MKLVLFAVVFLASHQVECSLPGVEFDIRQMFNDIYDRCYGDNHFKDFLAFVVSVNRQIAKSSVKISDEELEQYLQQDRGTCHEKLPMLNNLITVLGKPNDSIQDLIHILYCSEELFAQIVRNGEEKEHSDLDRCLSRISNVVLPGPRKISLEEMVLKSYNGCFRPRPFVAMAFYMTHMVDGLPTKSQKEFSAEKLADAAHQLNVDTEVLPTCLNKLDDDLAKEFSTVLLGAALSKNWLKTARQTPCYEDLTYNYLKYGVSGTIGDFIQCINQP